MNWNLLRPKRLVPAPPDSTDAYIIMQFCHFCGIQSFVSGPLFISICLFYSRHTKLPGQKCARPRRRRRPRPQAPSAPSARCCRCCSLSSPSQQVAPAAAASRALVGVAVVDLFFAAAVPAGGARHGHVCVGIAGVEILQRGTCCSESISDNAQ